MGISSVISDAQGNGFPPTNGTLRGAEKTVLQDSGGRNVRESGGISQKYRRAHARSARFRAIIQNIGIQPE